MRILSSLVAATATAAVYACASSPPRTDVNDVRVRGGAVSQGDQLDVTMHLRDNSRATPLNVPVVQAFDALPDAYKKLGVSTVAVVDTTGGVYTVGVVSLPLHGTLGGTRLSKYLDCGDSPMRVPANSYDVTFSATSYLTPSASGSMLHTLVTADARDPASNNPPVRCSSTGEFEKALAEKALAGMTGTP